MMFTRSRSRGVSLFAFALLLLSLFVVTVNAQDRCEAEKTQYVCPNCGGIEIDDCLKCDGFEYADKVHDICIRRVLFNQKNTDITDFENHYHYLLNDILGMILWFFTAAFAISAGVGGGGIYVPLGMLVFQFAPKQASGLSQASVFGAAMGGLILNSQNFHPNETFRSDPGLPDEKKGNLSIQSELTPRQEEAYLAKGGKFYTRPLISYDMVLFLAPAEMAGALLGVLIQRLIPNWLYLIVAALVLGFTGYKTFLKFFSTHKSEQEARAKAAALKEAEGKVNDAELEAETVEDPSSEDSSDAEANDDELRQRIAFLEQDATQFPKRKILPLIVMWIGLLILTLMRGGKGVDSIIGITCENPWFLGLLFVQFAWLFSFTGFFGYQVHKEQEARIAVRYPFAKDDSPWDWRNLNIFVFFTFLAGIIAGLIGIGGGMILNPLCMHMGVNPRVSSATTATMIALTSSSVVFGVITSGILHWSYPAFYCVVTISGALIGKGKIDAIVKRTGRASILVFILATIIVLATIGCIGLMLQGLKEDNWCLDGFQEFCVVKSDSGDCPADRLLNDVSNFAAAMFPSN